jgi:hypothetical protein
MLAKKHPAPLAGGDRAGTNVYDQQDSRPNPKSQDIRSQRLNGNPSGTAYKRVIPSAAERREHYRRGREWSVLWEQFSLPKHVDRILAVSGSSSLRSLLQNLQERGALSPALKDRLQGLLDGVVAEEERRQALRTRAVAAGGSR